MKNCGNVRLPGAKFVLIDECGRELACGVTNDCGELEFDCLPPGKYYIKELEAPCGYEKSRECAEVRLCDCSLHRCVEFVNERKKGSIKIVKYGVC
jgi:hypothetical protein